MKLLFPVVRFSKVSKMLSPFVVNMAKIFSAELHVVRVEEMIDQYLEMRIKEAEEWLDAFINENFKACKVHKSPILLGDPAKKILEYIKTNEMDCVIIGTHGNRGLRTVLFGNVAKEVVGKSPVPVLTINPYLMTNPFIKRNAVYLDGLMNVND